MRFFAPPANAEAWEDRSPDDKTIGATTVVNDESGATLVTYTVPATRRAHLGGCSLSVAVTVAAAAGVEAIMGCQLTPSGGAAKQLVTAICEAGAIGDQAYAATNLDAFVDAGDKVDITIALNDVTGTATMAGGVVITEFDA